MTHAPDKGHPLLRPLYFVAGLLFVALGVIGIFVVVMPTTIFMILAAWCFSRSSPRLEAWLLNHPKFGPSVVAWQVNGAIPRKIKYVAIGSMMASFVIVLLVHVDAPWTWVIGGVLLASAIFVGTRPEGPKAAR